jgi:hypothetical protein
MYDTMMPDYGYETEEERRRRLELEAQGVEPTPVKQTITTDPRTGQQTMKIEGSVEDLSANNALTPTVSTPVSPDEVAGLRPDQVGAYDRMLQVESGNRDYDSQGRPITSPKGAMYASQVMPATARDPGFGITPARDQSPEEYNRVGREYYGAMLRKYNGNDLLAQAAYNAGPGRVDQAIRMSQQRGDSPFNYLPRETQNYVQQVSGGNLQQISSMTSPRDQAKIASLPKAQVQNLRANAGPGTVSNEDQLLNNGPVSPYSLVQPQQDQTSNMPGVGLQAQPTNTAGLEQMQRGTFGTSIPHVEEYLANKGNLTGLLQLSQNESNPQWIRNKARQDVGFELNAERQKKEAEERLATMQPMDLERALREKTTGGSWLKAIAFGLLGMNVSAEAEQAKLGIGKEISVMGPDGKTPYLVKMSSNGTPIDGYNAQTGQKLSANELVSVAAGGQRKLDLVGGSYINDKTQEVGRMVTDKTTGQSYIQTDTGQKPMTGFRPQTSTGSLQDMRTRALMDLNIKLAGKTKEEAMQILRPYNQQLVAGGYAPIDPTEINLKVPQVGAEGGGGVAQTGGATTGGGQQITGTATGGATTGGATAVDTSGRRPTSSEMTLRSELKKKEQLIPLEVGELEQKEYVKTKDDLITKAEGGRNVANARRAQFDVIRSNPQIIGIFNGTGDAYTKAQSIIRELSSGAYGSEDRIRLSEDIRKLSIPQPQQAALEQFMQLNTDINRETLKANSGAGSISDAEQRANKESNMTFIGNYTPFAALNGMSRSQYSGDIARAKADYANTHKEFKTRQEFDSAWSKEQNKLEKQYEAVYKARLNMVKPFADASNKNPNDQQTLARYRDAVMHSFTAYPVPDYNPQSGRWDYKTSNTKKAAMSAILGR